MFSCAVRTVLRMGHKGKGSGSSVDYGLGPGAAGRDCGQSTRPDGEAEEAQCKVSLLSLLEAAPETAEMWNT
jgi:hypothetical protein